MLKILQTADHFFFLLFFDLLFPYIRLPFIYKSEVMEGLRKTEFEELFPQETKDFHFALIKRNGNKLMVWVSDFL